MAPAAYAFKMTDAATGVVLAQLPYSKAQFTRLVSAAGSWSADLPVGDTKVQRLDPWNNTTLSACEIVIERNRQVVYSGLVTDRSYDSKAQVLTVSGRESWCYFDRRLIEWDLTYAAVDQGLIVQDILTRAKGSPAGDFRVDLPTTAQLTTGVPRDRTYLALDAKQISAAIEELAAVQGGFEFALNGYWSTVAGGLSTLRHQLVFGYPMLGSRGGRALTWEAGQGGAVTQYTWGEAGTALVNEVFGIGDNGSGGVRINRSKRLPGRWPLLQSAVSFRAVSSPATLKAHSDAEVVRLQAGVVVAHVVVLGDRDPQVGSYVLGDDATFDFNDARFSGVAQQVRLKGWTVQFPGPGQAETVDLLVS